MSIQSKTPDKSADPSQDQAISISEENLLALLGPSKPKPEATKVAEKLEKHEDPKPAPQPEATLEILNANQPVAEPAPVPESKPAPPEPAPTAQLTDVDARLALIAAIKENRSAHMRTQTPVEAPPAPKPTPVRSPEPVVTKPVAPVQISPVQTISVQPAQATPIRVTPVQTTPVQPSSKPVREEIAISEPELKPRVSVSEPVRPTNPQPVAPPRTAQEYRPVASEKKKPLGLIIGAAAGVAAIAGIAIYFAVGHHSSPKPAATATVQSNPANSAPTPATAELPAPQSQKQVAAAPVPQSVRPAAESTPNSTNKTPEPTAKEEVAPTPAPARPTAREFVPPTRAKNGVSTPQVALPDLPAIPNTQSQLNAPAIPLAVPAAPPPTTAPLSAPTTSTPRQITVASNLQSAKLIKRVTPPIAKSARVQGIVRFNAIVGKDGRIQDLKVVSGPTLLVEAAKDALKQWVYQPTLLNGQPVEVLTQIEVTFSLTH